MSRRIARARRVMRKAFERDRLFKQIYIASVSIILYESGISRGSRDKMAEKILDRIFMK